MQLISWSDGERYLRPPQSLAVSLLLSLVSTLLFSRTGGLLSHRNSLTHRLPRFPLRNLCSLVMLAVFFLIYAATDTAFCLVLISLGLEELRALPAAPADISHLILHCPATDSLRRSLFVSLRLLVQGLENCPVLRLHGLPPCPPYSSEGVG